MTSMMTMKLCEVRVTKISVSYLERKVTGRQKRYRRGELRGTRRLNAENMPMIEMFGRLEF